MATLPKHWRREWRRGWSREAHGDGPAAHGGRQSPSTRNRAAQAPIKCRGQACKPWAGLQTMRRSSRALLRAARGLAAAGEVGAAAQSFHAAPSALATTSAALARCDRRSVAPLAPVGCHTQSAVPTMCDLVVCGPCRRPGALGHSRLLCLGGLRAFSALPPHTVSFRVHHTLRTSRQGIMLLPTAAAAAACCCPPPPMPRASPALSDPICFCWRPITRTAFTQPNPISCCRS